METPQARVGTGVLIFKDGKILLGKRIGTKHGSGEYSSPGGHLDYMESIDDCAKREVLEECGVTIKNLKFLHVANQLDYLPHHFVNISFTADWESGEPQVLEPEKCENWGWYDIDNLPEPVYSMTKLAIQSYKNKEFYHDSKINK